jgi:acyl carrier protein
MSDAELLEVIREALIGAKPKLERKIKNLTMETRLDEFDLDSLATTTTSGYIEDQLDIMLDEGELPKVETLGQFVALIRASMAAKT